MAGLDRSQFKATSTVQLKKTKVEEDKLFGAAKTEEIEIIEGMNKIRIAPKFPNEQEYYLKRVRTWVPYQKEDGQLTVVPVYNSRTHGGTEKDIIEEYVKFVKSRLSSSSAEDAKKLTDLVDWKKGLNPQIDWRAYGWKIVKDELPVLKEFGFGKSVRDELCSLAIIEDEDEAIDVDPFTDPDTGLPILITYDKTAKSAKDKYKTKLAKNPYPMTDAMFEQLVSKKPLSEIYRNNYNIEEFDKALEGIRIYDVNNEIDLVDDEDFLEIIAEVRAQYGSAKPAAKVAKISKTITHDDDDEESTPVAKAPKKVVAPVVKEEEEEEEEERPAPAPKKAAKVVEEEEEEEERPEVKEVVAEEPKPEKKKLTIEELKAKLAKKQ